MSIRPRFALVAAVIVAAMVTGVHGRTAPDDAELQFQIGTLLFEETRFREALEAFRKATRTDNKSIAVQARIGVVKSALRLGEFAEAQREAATLKKAEPRSAEIISIHADALWSGGLFDEADREFRDALALAPDLSRGHHGLARALASQNKLDEALNEAQIALKLAPRDEEMHHTVGAIFERMRRYEQAAAAYGNYVNLLPNKDRSDKASWSRSQIRFLKSFGEREPIAIDDQGEDQLHTVDFRVVDEKVIVKARVNGGRPQDFVLDTGSELTTISRQTASSAVVRPITYTLSAGVGEVGLRGLQLGRLDTLEIGTLKLSNVPTLIKAPALRGIPKRETESFSPLGLGLSMTIDYAAHKLSIGKTLPAEQGRVHAADAASPADAGARHDQPDAPDLLRGRHRRRGHLDQHRDGGRHQPDDVAEDRAAGLRHVGVGPRRVPDAGRQPALQRHRLQQLRRGGAEPAGAERAARLPGRRHRRAQVPEPVPRLARSRSQRAANDEKAN